MNLEQYVKANPTDELSTVQGYEHTVDKMISPDMMLAILTQFNHIDLLDTPLENANTSMTKEAKALRKAFSFGSEFNLINGHPASVIALFSNMLNDEIISQPFYDYCISYANKTTYPLALTTQEELNAVKLKLALYVETAPLNIGYPVINPDLDYAVVLSNKSVQFSVVLAAPAPVDLVVEVFVHTDYSDNKTFDSVGLKVGFIRIAAGETNGSIIVKKPLSSKIQASAKSNVSGDYNLIVKAG